MQRYRPGQTGHNVNAQEKNFDHSQKICTMYLFNITVCMQNKLTTPRTFSIGVFALLAGIKCISAYSSRTEIGIASPIFFSGTQPL